MPAVLFDERAFHAHRGAFARCAVHRDVPADGQCPLPNVDQAHAADTRLGIEAAAIITDHHVQSPRRARDGDPDLAVRQKEDPCDHSVDSRALAAKWPAFLESVPGILL